MTPRYFLANFLLPALSGFLCFQISPPPTHEYLIALPFAFVPLWYCWTKTRSLMSVFLTGWIAQFVYNLFTYFWVKHTSQTFFGATELWSWFFVFAFAAVAHIGIPLTGVAWKYLENSFAISQRKSLVILVLISVLFEFLFPRIFPFSFGHPWMWSGLASFQLAEWIGFDGLSLLTFTVNALALAVVFDLVRFRSIKALQKMALTIGILIGTHAIGKWRESIWTKTDANLTVHLLQSFIEPIEMLSFRYGKDEALRMTLDHLFHLQDFAAKPSNSEPDLAIWSETVAPFDVANSNEFLGHLKDYLKEQRVPHIIGAYRYKDTLKHNSAVLFNSGGEVEKIYDKQILMPFGEYLPFEEQLPWLRKLSPATPQYGLGDDETPFLIGDARLGPSICYEMLFSSHSRQLTRAGSNMFFNVTSDYWFGPTNEPIQHNSLAVAKAIEFRRPLIRVADSGISSVIQANGKILAWSPIWQEWQQTVTVQFLKDPPLTFYDRNGTWFPLIVGASVFGLLATSSRRRNKKV